MKFSRNFSNRADLNFINRIVEDSAQFDQVNPVSIQPPPPVMGEAGEEDEKMLGFSSPISPKGEKGMNRYSICLLKLGSGEGIEFI